MADISTRIGKTIRVFPRKKALIVDGCGHSIATIATISQNCSGDRPRRAVGSAKLD
jgi:hypothetical protein